MGTGKHKTAHPVHVQHTHFTHSLGVEHPGADDELEDVFEGL